MTKQLRFTLLKNISFNVIGMLGLSAYILADTFFIATGIGPLGIGALNIALPVFSLINATGLMLGMGGATLYTITKVQEKQQNANQVFTKTMLLGLLFSLLFIILGIFFNIPIAKLLGSDDEILPLSKSYLRILLLFAPFFIFNNILLAFTRNDNAIKLGMLATIIGSLLNIILDYIFIFPLNLGMSGAAIATIVSPFISILIISTHFYSKDNNLAIVKIKLKISKFHQIILTGSSTFITELSSGVVIIFFNHLILSYAGNIGIAAFGITTNISLILVAVYTGINQGLQPLASLYYSKDKLTRAYTLFRFTMLIAVISSIIIYILIFIYKTEIVNIFNPQQNIELQKIAEEALTLYFTAFIFLSQNIIITGFLTAINQPKKALLFSLLRGFLVIVPILIIMAYHFQLTGIFLTLTASESIVYLISIMTIKKSNSLYYTQY